jgi:hypothetical protein
MNAEDGTPETSAHHEPGIFFGDGRSGSVV